MANYGGGIHNNGITTLTDVAIQNNQASNDGGGISAATFGNLTLTDDTLSGNQALNGSGGAIVSAAGANTLTLIDDTIANNYAKVAGGGLSLGYTVHLNNDTISDNTAASGGGIFLAGTATCTIYNTIVDGSSAGKGADVYLTAGGTFTSSGGNLYGDKTGTETNVAWNSSGSMYPDRADKNDNPNLDSLQNNGGPTLTMAELPGSPALQWPAQRPGGTTPASTDQRGFLRIVNGKIDIGAFENQSQLFTLTNPANAVTNAGQSTAFNLGSLHLFRQCRQRLESGRQLGRRHSRTDLTTFTVTSQGSLGTQNHTYMTAGSYNLGIAVTDANGNFASSHLSVGDGDGQSRTSRSARPACRPTPPATSIARRSVRQAASREATPSAPPATPMA